MTPEEYERRRVSLEAQWIAEIKERIALVEAALHPIPVSQWWIESLALPAHEITKAHLARVNALETEYYRALELAEGDTCAS